MALLNRKVDYGILVLSHLAHRPRGNNAREIAAKFGLSRPFVANILKELCQKGFVTSHRGVKGGYELHDGVEDVSLADFVAELDDSFQLAECNRPASESPCTLHANCPVRGGIASVHNRLMDVLRNVTLGELFGPAQDGSIAELVTLTVP